MDRLESELIQQLTSRVPVAFEIGAHITSFNVVSNCCSTLGGKTDMKQVFRVPEYSGEQTWIF